MLTLKRVNKAIEEKYPKVFLVKGNGYYYLASDDSEIGLKLATLHTTSIDIFDISHLSLERWMDEVKYVLSDSNRSEDERSPVY